MLKLTPAQCRAARGLTGMTQPQLADAAGVGLSTVVDFEKERRKVSDEVMGKIASALDLAGVQLIPVNGGGSGVRWKEEPLG